MHYNVTFSSVKYLCGRYRFFGIVLTALPVEIIRRRLA